MRRLKTDGPSATIISLVPVLGQDFGESGGDVPRSTSTLSDCLRRGIIDFEFRGSVGGNFGCFGAVALARGCGKGLLAACGCVHFRQERIIQVPER